MYTAYFAKLKQLLVSCRKASFLCRFLNNQVPCQSVSPSTTSFNNNFSHQQAHVFHPMFILCPQCIAPSLSRCHRSITLPAAASPCLTGASCRRQEQLNGLMKTLNSTQPHFIRCIIPNEFKQTGESALVSGRNYNRCAWAIVEYVTRTTESSEHNSMRVIKILSLMSSVA